MDILDESFGATPEQVQLDDLIETRPLTSSVPSASIRNRAALDALLTSNPQDMVEKYRLLVKEGEEGSTISHEEAVRRIDEHNRNKTMRHVINLLGDKNIPLDQKERLFDLVQREGYKEEPAMTLRTNALTAPSDGESLRGENARISTAEMMAEIHADAQKRQRMVNTVMAATLPNASPDTVVEIAEAEVMPFGRNALTANLNEAIRKAQGEDTSFFKWVGDFLTPGTTKQAIREKLSRIPLDKREEFVAGVLDGIKNSKSVFTGENYYNMFRSAEELLMQAPASDAEAWTENVMTLFDVFWIADGVKRVTKGAKAVAPAVEADTSIPRGRRPGSADPGVEDVDFNEVHRADWELVKDPTNPMQIGKPKDRIGMSEGPKKLAGPKPEKEADDMKRVQLNSVVKQENPVSPYAIIEQSNPEQARSIHAAVAASKSDELSEAVAGVSREQFMANNLLPQVGSELGSVLAKVDQSIIAGVKNTGATRFTEEELSQAYNSVQRGFRNIHGLEINDAMTTFRLDGDRVIVEAHYTAPGGSFDTVAEAKAHAKFYLKEYGVRDDEIEIMKREGLDYVVHEGTDLDVGDFIIKVKTDHELSADDISNWSKLDVKRNFFDRFSFAVSDHGGSVSRHLFDPASMLHPTLTRSASVGTDQTLSFENILLKPIKELRNEIEGMDKARRAKVEEYIKEANLKQIAFDPAYLAGQGFTKKEIDALRKWQDIQDGHYYLENLDLVRTLRTQNYQLFENSNIRVFAKPAQKNQNIGRVYDPAIDDVRILTQQEMDDLYDQGGTYAKLRRPENINGYEVDHIVVRNTPTEYLRGLRDTDKVLNYRPGYYTIYYKAPKFVEEAYIDPTTKQKSWRAVAVAGSQEEADIYLSNAQAATGSEYRVRNDIRAVRHEDDSYWDLEKSKGRIAQRHRGQTLQDASGLQHVGDSSYIAHPMESAVRAAKSLADRTMMRNILETAKERAIAQYGEMFPPNGIGGRRFPNSVGEISDKGDPRGKSAADARTTVEYIRYLENGYINSTDEWIKGHMNVLADFLGSKHFTIGEKAARGAASFGPTGFIKGSVFQAYIALNPLRQLILQPHQAIRMAAFNPKGYAKANLLAAKYLHNKMIGATDDFTKFVDDSGVLAGVDQHSLVRGLKLDLADSASKPKRILGEVAAAPQKFGFNAGEQVNQLIHMSNVFEKRMREGKDLVKNKTLRDEAYAEARALSYEMNYAGDMPYNQTAAAAIFQFLQVPQKAFLQLTNRKLKGTDVARVAVFDMVMWGSPVAGLAAWMGADLDIEDEEIRQIVNDGLEAFALNKFFTMITGEETNVDYGSLSPYDLSGWVKMWDAFMEDGMLSMLAASPAAQLWVKDGGRIPNAMNMMGRWLNLVEDYEEDRPTFMAVMNEVAKVSSGWNNAYKASIMLSARKKFDQYGNVTDDAVSTPEAFHQLLGFGPKSEAELYELSKQVRKWDKKHKEEVDKMYNDIMRVTTQHLETDKADIRYILSLQNKLMMAFKNDPMAQDYVRRKWQEDMKGKERQLTEKMIRAAGLPDAGNYKDMVRAMPVDENTKQLLLQRYEDIRTLRGDKE